MSADNGIYIGKFPKGLAHNDQGEDCIYYDTFEYRVIHAQNIEDCEYGSTQEMKDASLCDYFGEDRVVKIFSDRRDALLFAHDWAKEFDILEYGVSEMEFDRPLVQMTKGQINEVLGF